MNIHKNARLTLKGRVLLVRRITEEGWRIVDAVNAAGISVRQSFRWLARYRSGAAALADRSSAPHQCKHGIGADRVGEIARLRQQRMIGPAIARELSMPISTVGIILRRLGLGKLAALEPKPAVVRHERQRPGELIHIDTKKLGRIAAVGHRITGDRRDTTRGVGWEALHVCIDDATRLANSEILVDERKASAVGFLERALGWFAGRCRDRARHVGSIAKNLHGPAETEIARSRRRRQQGGIHSRRILSGMKSFYRISQLVQLARAIHPPLQLDLSGGNRKP